MAYPFRFGVNMVAPTARTPISSPSPAPMVGTPARIADTLRERRKSLGFNYITVLEHV